MMFFLNEFLASLLDSGDFPGELCPTSFVPGADDIRYNADDHGVIVESENFSISFYRVEDPE